MTLNKRNLLIKSVFALSFLWVCHSIAQEEEAIAADKKIESGSYNFSLEEATRLALHNNFDIQLTKYDIWISRTRKGAAESLYDTLFEADINYQNDQSKQTSTLLGTKSLLNNYNIGLSKKIPSGTTLSLDMTNNRNWTNSPFAVFSPSHDSALKMTVEQALGKNFFGIQDRGSVKVTKFQIEQTHYSSLEKIEKEIARVQKAYWDLALAIERKKIAAQMFEQAERLFRLHEEKSKDGLTELPELYAAEANYKTRLTEHLIAENEVKAKTNVLKLLLNIAEDIPQIRAVDEMVVSLENMPFNQALAAALENRRDYQAGLTQVRQRDVELAMNKNSLWPEINLTASLARNGLGDHFSQAVRQISEEDNPDLFAGLKISWPLENTKAKAQVDQAQIQKARALVNLKFIERKIFISVADRVRDCNILMEKARSHQEITKLQELKLNGEQKRFNAGRSETDTIIRFQEDLLKAKWEAAQAAYEYQVSKIDLKLEQGILLSEYWDGEL